MVRWLRAPIQVVRVGYGSCGFALGRNSVKKRDKWPITDLDLPTASDADQEPRLGGMSENPVFRLHTFVQRPSSLLTDIITVVALALYMVAQYWYFGPVAAYLVLLFMYCGMFLMDLMSASLKGYSGGRFLCSEIYPFLSDVVILPVTVREFAHGIWAHSISRRLVVQNRILAALPIVMCAYIMLATEAVWSGILGIVVCGESFNLTLSLYCRYHALMKCNRGILFELSRYASATRGISEKKKMILGTLLLSIVLFSAVTVIQGLLGIPLSVVLLPLVGLPPVGALLCGAAGGTAAGMIYGRDLRRKSDSRYVKLLANTETYLSMIRSEGEASVHK